MSAPAYIASLHSVEDVRALSAKQLNQALKHHGKSICGKRKHKIRVLCEALEITVHECDFKQLLSIVRDSKTGWVKDIRKCPCVSLNQVIDYLLRSHDTITHTKSGGIEHFTVANLRRYKTLRSYDLYRSKHVHSMLYYPMTNIDGDYCAIKAKCNPSWDTSGTMYDCVALFESDCGKPVGSSCTCVAGEGEACTHVAAMLFALEDFTSLGYQDLPDDPASTELLCAWNGPNNPKVTPTVLKELNYQHQAPGAAPSKHKKKRLADHNPVAPNKRTINADSYRRLVHDLGLCQPDVPFLTIAEPEKWEPPCVKPAEQAILSLPAVTSDDNPLLVPAAEAIVTTTPAQPTSVMTAARSFTLHQNPEGITDDVVQQFMNSLQVSTDEQHTVADLTLGQSKNPLWKEYRQGMVTSTTAHAVYTRMESVKSEKTTNADRLVNEILNVEGTFKGNSATKYGQDKEPLAAKTYGDMMKLHHTNFKLNECGLTIMKSRAYIGASIDRMATCDCHQQRPVEIKCPSTMETKPKGSFVQLPYIKESSHGLVLKSKPVPHAHYTQVQCHMAVTDTLMCDFVVWSPNETCIITIEFDSVFWLKVQNNVCVFYRKFLAPKILSDAKNKSSSSHGQIAKDNFVKQYVCGNKACNSLLVSPDTLEAVEESVMCECHCGCGVWYHWTCSNLKDISPNNSELLPPWICPECNQSC